MTDIATPNPGDGEPTSPDQSGDIAGTPVTNLETAPDDALTDTESTSSGYSEDDPLHSDGTGNSYWVKDGKTYRSDRQGSWYETDGDHTDTVKALTELFPDLF